MTLANNPVAGSRAMLRQSGTDLDAGKLAAASEKAWAAVALRFDVIARSRNWQYGEMGDYSRIADRLMTEVVQPKQFVGLFGEAFSLHFNQFRDDKTPRQVASDINAVTRLLAMLEDVE